MKKIFISFVLFALAVSGANAQVVISNDYANDATLNNVVGGIYGNNAASRTASGNDDGKSERFVTLGLTYYNFGDVDGESIYEYGMSNMFVNPGHIGLDFNIRVLWKSKINNYGVDLGPNFAIDLWKQDNKGLFIILGAGLSYHESTVDLYGVKTKSKGFGLFANPRLALKFGKVVLSGGYFLGAHKFKFSKEYKYDGFNISLAVGMN